MIASKFFGPSTHDMGNGGIARSANSTGPAIDVFLGWGENHLQKRKVLKKVSFLPLVQKGL